MDSEPGCDNGLALPALAGAEHSLSESQGQHTGEEVAKERGETE